MHNFDYHQPADVNEAARLLKDNPDARLLAGGHTLLPSLKQRLAAPGALVDLGQLSDLRGVRRDGDDLIIGALTCHAAVAGDAAVKDAIPALADLAEAIGDPQVRNRGTIGGSIANHDPAADYPAAVLGLGATIKTDRREISVDDFFTGLLSTALDDAEIITAVSFPIPQQAGYAKFPQPASRYALVGVFVAQTAAGVRVAVTGAGANGVFRSAELETALAKDFSAAAAAQAQIPAANLASDIHASAEYRAHLVGVMAQRAVAACG